MEHLKKTWQRLESSSVSSLLRNNQYASHGTYFADTDVNLNKVEEVFEHDLVLGDSY